MTSIWALIAKMSIFTNVLTQLSNFQLIGFDLNEVGRGPGVAQLQARIAVIL